MSTQEIRVFGDPVLRRPTTPVTDIDGAFVALVEAMYDTMHAAPGSGLAACQVGVQKRFFVFDEYDGSGPDVLINPQIVDGKGSSPYEEGCLSIPGYGFEVIRPEVVTVTALDLDGREVTIETGGHLARVFQHETDHLDGILVLDRLDPDQRKRAMRALREHGLAGETPGGRRHAL